MSNSEGERDDFHCCPDCGTTWDSALAAERCCDGKGAWRYVCDICETGWDDVMDLEECCMEGDDE